MSPTASKAAPPIAADRLLLALDLGGTLLFAGEGAVAAVAAGLDLLGVMIIAFTTALGGGITRDLLLGLTPPAALRDVRYPLVAFAGGGAVLVGRALGLGIWPRPVLVLDALALSLFAVAGARRAQSRGLPALLVVCLGAITGCGGGVLRDLFLARIPQVLNSDVYATAALAGAAAMLLFERARISPWVAALLGAAVCAALRLLAVAHGWQLPHPR